LFDSRKTSPAFFHIELLSGIQQVDVECGKRGENVQNNTFQWTRGFRGGGGGFNLENKSN